MILVGPNSDCIITGKVTGQGASLKYISKNKVPIYAFTVMVDYFKDEGNNWKTKYIDCEMFGNAIKRAPKISGGEYVLCTGKYKRKSWKRTDGQSKIIETMRCDGCIIFGEKNSSGEDVRDLFPKDDKEEFYTVNGEDLIGGDLCVEKSGQGVN